METTIDLKAKYGKKYRVQFEEGHMALEKDSVWFQVIPCRNGDIFIYDETRLGGCCNRVKIAARWGREIDGGLWPGCEIIQRGDFEIMVAFLPDLFQRVATLLRAKMKRQYTPEQIARMSEHLKKVREKIGSSVIS